MDYAYEQANTAISELDFWLKVRSNTSFSLADFPEIVRLRWPYFRDNWFQILPNLQGRISQNSNPDLFRQQLEDMSSFVEVQKVIPVITNPFQDPTIIGRFFTVFAAISVNDIDLTNEERKIFNNKIQKFSSYGRSDILRIKNQIRKFRDDYVDSIGLGDSDYNTIYNRHPSPHITNATVTDFKFLLVLEQSLRSCDFALANDFALEQLVDRFAVARQIAQNPDINIANYSSGRLARLQVGESLEDLANRFFGDPNRWIDIALANGLQPPYIDEVGSSIQLTSNGSGNNITISATDSLGQSNKDKLYINQTVTLRSNAYPVPVNRTIVSIKEVPITGDLIIELDGEPNLNNYTVADAANIRVYKPNTINSQLYVLIPGSKSVEEDQNTYTPWFLQGSAADEKRAGIDIKLSRDGDLIFLPNGDIDLSFGVENAAQAMRLKLSTELGSLPFHPEFGFVTAVGKKINNIDELRQLVTSSIINQVEADPRFDSVISLNVQYGSSTTGTAALLVDVAVKMAGSDNVIPISFSVPLNS